MMTSLPLTTVNVSLQYKHNVDDFVEVSSICITSEAIFMLRGGGGLVVERNMK